MKLKEVCTQTGLSRKTIRLYEEKGLLVPQMERRNGRDYREYTPENIRTLKTIAMLRRAWFTMDEIKQMMDEPEAIQTIFPQYVEWLQNQKQELDSLLSVAKAVNSRYVSNIDQLSGAMSKAASKMPLPQYDIKPRFKHLDEIEERPNIRPPADPLDLVMSGDKEKAQAAVAISRDKRDDLLVKVSMMNETAAIMKDVGSGPVPDRETEKDPWWLKIITGILTILFALSIINFVNVFIHFAVYWEDLAFFGICFVLRGSLFLWKHQREQNAWLERMGYPRQKRNLGDINIKQLRKIVIIALIILLVIALIIVYMVIMKANLEPDYSVCFITKQNPREYTTDILEDAIGYVVDDVNGDGVVKIQIEYLKNPSQYVPGDYHLVLFDRKFHSKLDESQFAILPEDHRNVYSQWYYNMEGSPFLKLSGMNTERVYGAIPATHSNDAFTAAMEVMLVLKEITFPAKLFRTTYENNYFVP